MEIVLRRHSKSEYDTQKAGEDLIPILSLPSLVFLGGELGAGKTVFVKGMARRLGLPPEAIQSPTFVLIREYLRGKIPLYHMDFYRLNDWEEVVSLGLEEYLEREGIVVIEWGDKFLPFFSPPFWMVWIQIQNQKEREIIVERWKT